ncbi:MAG: hypothetical protein AAGA50_03795 [Pseudomonadota bacterium]
MRTTRKILSPLIAAAFVSGAFIGTAYAIDNATQFGDLSGNEPLSVQTMRAQNERALRSSQKRSVNAYSAGNTNRAYADFPDQAFGDLSGNNPVPIRRQSVENRASGSDSLLILQFQGDWNGTAKEGFPHR